MVGQSIAHLGLVFVPLPPFIALTVVSILQKSGSSRRLGVQLGLLVVGQYLISPEVLATTALLTVAALACIVVRNPMTAGKLLRGSSAAIGFAFIVAVALLAYPVWMSFFGPQHFTGPPSSTANPFHSDLFSSVVPGPEQRVSFGLRSLGNRLAAYSGNEEADGYIGGPVLLLSAVLAWRSRRSYRMQLAVVLMAFSLILSFGPYLAVDGRLTGIPLPFLVLDHLPVLDSILPSRVSLEMDACLAGVIAFGIDDLHRAPADPWIRSRGSAIFAFMTLLLLVITQLPLWPEPSANAPVVALPSALERAVPGGDPVAITYPYDTRYSNEPMLWQAESSFRFRLLGGYAYHGGPGGGESLYPFLMNPPGPQRFLADQGDVGMFGPERPVSPTLVAATRAAVSRYDVRLVIVDRSMTGSRAVMELFNDALGPPALSGGHFSLWANWHGSPKREQFSQHISTRLLAPTNGTLLSGTVELDAAGSADYRITKVAFVLSDETHHSEVIANGTPTLYGWSAKWNTAGVAKGTYSLQSIAYDEFGASKISPAITVTINS
jgi:Bacterial Ig domain